MADLSIKNLGIGLAGSLLAGAISVTAATGVGASAPPGASAGSYVYTESNQLRDGGNAVLAFRGAQRRQPHVRSAASPPAAMAPAQGSGRKGRSRSPTEGMRLLAVNAALQHRLVLPDPLQRDALGSSTRHRRAAPIR